MISTENGIFEVDPDDSYISSHMSTGKIFEHHIINGVLKEFVEKSKYIVDVGANIGCHAVSYAGFNPDCKIWAFEPQDKLFTILKKNVEQNGYEERIEIYKCGLGHREMECELASLDSVHDANCQVWNKGGLGIGEGGETMTILTLDSFDLPGLDYMKIDVEGAEGLVIMGARETIKKYRPVICFEHNYQRIDPEHIGLRHIPTPFEELVKLGYRIFVYLDWENYIAYP